MQADIAVIGAGVVGCAIAAELASPSRSVLLLEAGARIGEGTTSRNSGVIHSGLYYPPASLKARACVEGNRLLYEWARAHGVAHAKPGKLVIARDREELSALEALAENARASGAPGIEMISRDAVARREPSLDALAALYCAETGIIDPVELTQSLAAHAAANGATIVTAARVSAIERSADGHRLKTSRGEICCARLVNAAGLHADEIAAMAGLTSYRIEPFRGDYFTLRNGVRYRHLIYPVHKPGDRWLGVHLTVDLAGRVRLGPDLEQVRSKTDFSPREDKLDAFLAAAQRLLGPDAVQRDQLQYESCGLRPRLAGAADFVVREDLPGLINLVGIESPGLTASLALARVVRQIIDS